MYYTYVKAAVDGKVQVSTHSALQGGFKKMLKINSFLIKIGCSNMFDLDRCCMLLLKDRLVF